LKLTFIGSGDACSTGGRNQTCILVEDDFNAKTFLIDCGPSTLTALKKINFDSNKIDFIINTHMHGDHYGGIPYLLLDFWINSNRKKELKIIGPRGIAQRVTDLHELLYSGLNFSRMSYQITFQELSPDFIENVDIYQVQTFLMEHNAFSDCLGYKISNGSKIFSYTGDTAWTDKLFSLAEGTDLFISECSFFNKNSKISHLSYQEIVDLSQKINTKKIVLTHLSEEMFANLDKVKFEIAHDLLQIQF